MPECELVFSLFMEIPTINILTHFPQNINILGLTKNLIKDIESFVKMCYNKNTALAAAKPRTPESLLKHQIAFASQKPARLRRIFVL